MRNATAIARKELNIYFSTPIAYVMFTLFVLIASYFFLQLLSGYEMYSMQVMRMAPEMLNRLNFQDAIFLPLFGNLGLIFVLIVPFLTMRLIAEEKRSRTIELLYTTPTTPGDIVFGKYLAALVVLTCTLALTLTYPILLQVLARDAGVEWRSVLLGYGGLWLLGAASMALGLFISSLTDSQVVAALITFVTLLLLWIVGWAARFAEGKMHDVLNYLSLPTHQESFSKGTIDLKDCLFFVSVVVLGLFATHRAVDAHRWS
jgi:ABC-2 type transport system permease protein